MVENIRSYLSMFFVKSYNTRLKRAYFSKCGHEWPGGPARVPYEVWALDGALIQRPYEPSSLSVIPSDQHQPARQQPPQRRGRRCTVHRVAEAAGQRRRRRVARARRKRVAHAAGAAAAECGERGGGGRGGGGRGDGRGGGGLQQVQKHASVTWHADVAWHDVVRLACSRSKSTPSCNPAPTQAECSSSDATTATHTA